MKFESVCIKCDNNDQLDHAIEIAKRKGYQEWGLIKRKEGSLFLALYDDGDYSVLVRNHNSCRDLKSYSEFVSENKEIYLEEKENEMIKKIHQAKKELGLNNTELSLRMGKSKPYIAKMLNQKQSEKVQNKVIKEIDELLSKKDIEINIGESKVTNSLNSPNAIVDTELLDKLKETKQHLEQKTILVGKLSDQLEAAERVHNEDLKTIKFQESRYLKVCGEKEQIEYERDHFVNQYKQSESDVKSLKKKIIRERWIIIIVIAILTGLFFLKGAIGG